jgi:hypothetical protein
VALKPKLTTEAPCGASRLTTCRVDVTGTKALRRRNSHVYVVRLGEAAVVESDNYEKRRAGNWAARRYFSRREGYMRPLTRRYGERAGGSARGASLSRVVGV